LEVKAAKANREFIVALIIHPSPLALFLKERGSR